ncbi:50S ribosomal protein L17 [Candidatus Saccharibacteria bacterium]|nr:50S ribosomal protein L17 [Candidatus Saccharibacteria bacterium]
MHRHGYKGRKFGRETDQRTALTRGLMRSLFKYQAINTTLAKAKEIRRPAEKLITLAKRGDLASRRLVIARLDDTEMGNYLVDVIAPQVKHDSGYLRIERNGFRVGDNTEMATISFVDDIKDMPKPAKKAATKAAPKAEKKADKKEEK